MDFFNGLDNGRYSSFKAEIINGLTAGSMKQPADLNEMYLLANQWLRPPRVTHLGWKPPSIPRSILKTRKKARSRSKTASRRLKVARKTREVGKDASEVECFNCGAIGRYANNCPQKKKHADSDAEEEE